MKFNFIDEVPFPREQVWQVNRDRLPALVPYMPTVNAIEVIERAQAGDVVKLVNRWTGASDDIPGMVRPFVKSEYMTWLDYATWDQDRWRIEWRLELNILPGAISASGFTEYQEEGDETLIHMNGEFRIHPERIPGLPSALASRVVPALERFVVGAVEPNLRKTNECVARYLEEEGF